VNLVLLFDEDFLDEGRRVRLTGRRLQHVREVHRAQEGDALRVGRLGGKVGLGRITRLCESQIEMQVELDAEPPAPLEVTLMLALPRPPVLRRVLIAATSMGVKQIVLHNAAAVEKSFWQSHALAVDAIRAQLVLGLEQACDTRLPEVLLRPRFRPFVEDELAALLGGARGWVAHPGASSLGLGEGARPAVIAIGPESGWSDFELERLISAGLDPMSLGPRPLRVETAVPALLAQLL
jgi:16S rRNA (uracil1498-N3)-methyltransferase